MKKPERSETVAPVASFVEYEGYVHLVGPLMGGEFTLCGDAWDAYSTESAPEREFKSTKKRHVTCPKCAAVILACRGVCVSNDLDEPSSTVVSARLQRRIAKHRRCFGLHLTQTRKGLELRCFARGHGGRDVLLFRMPGGEPCKMDGQH